MATREESAFSGDPGERGRSEPPSSGGEAVRKPSTRIPILDGWRATSILCVLGAHLVRGTEGTAAELCRRCDGHGAVLLSFGFFDRSISRLAECRSASSWPAGSRGSFRSAGVPS